MKKLTSTLLICAALLAVLGGSLILYNNFSGQLQPQTIAPAPPAVSETEEPGEVTSPDTEDLPQKVFAPDFTVYDADGNEVHLSDFRGKPVVLNFWASWCGPCKMEMPDLEKAYQEYGDQIQFMLVDLTDGSQETVEKASAFIKEQGYTFPVFYDTAME